MSLTFKAIIDGVHIDPKKGTVKIQLVATSSVSLDKLTTLSPKDESIHVTLESEQTKIDVFPLTPEVGEHYRDEGHEDQSHEGPPQRESIDTKSPPQEGDEENEDDDYDERE